MDFIKSVEKRGEPKDKIKKKNGMKPQQKKRWYAGKGVKGITKQNQHSYKKKGEKEKWK